MTEETAPLQARLRYGARNIHSIGPDHAAGLLQAAAALIDAQLEALEEKPGQLLVVDLQNGDVEARTDLLAGLVAALETHTVIATVAGSAQQQLGEDVAATRAKQLEATEAVRAAKTALETHNATEREDVSRALDLLDELRNTAIPVARLREEMLKPAREYLKARLVALGG